MNQYKNKTLGKRVIIGWTNKRAGKAMWEKDGRT
jgi:hypothetical protein